MEKDPPWEPSLMSFVLASSVIVSPLSTLLFLSSLHFSYCRYMVTWPPWSSAWIELNAISDITASFIYDITTYSNDIIILSKNK